MITTMIYGTIACVFIGWILYEIDHAPVVEYWEDKPEKEQ